MDLGPFPTILIADHSRSSIVGRVLSVELIIQLEVKIKCTQSVQTTMYQTECHRFVFFFIITHYDRNGFTVDGDNFHQGHGVL